MDGKREGHGRIGRAFCSAHFREVPVLLRDSGPGSGSDAPAPGARPRPGAAGDPATPRGRRFIDAFRAEAERSFHPGQPRPVEDDGRTERVLPGRAAPVQRSTTPGHPPPPPTESVPLPPNADMVADGVEAVTCLDYGVRCTGWLCPLFALPTVPPEDLLAEAMAAERRRWRRHDPGAARRRPRADAARPSDPTDPASPGPPSSHTF